MKIHFADINDCLGEPCLNGGTCEDQFGKYVCHCQGGNTDPNCYVPGKKVLFTDHNLIFFLTRKSHAFTYTFIHTLLFIINNGIKLIYS